MAPTPTSSSSPEEVELPLEERIQLALARYQEAQLAKETISQRKIARLHGVPKSTLQDRIHGRQATHIRNEQFQRLSSEEEEAIHTWILRLQNWGWPPRIEQVRFMAIELLQQKGDTEPIGINWPQKFLNRHPQIKTAYIPPLDKERASAENHDTLAGWFELFSRFKEEYAVKEEDIYNMDERGFMQGVIAKTRVMISKHEKKAHMTQCGNREWVSLIECVSMSGRLLKPWVIFKAKQKQKAWFEVLKEGHIAVSENGWTDNELGLAWLQKCFDPETIPSKEGDYRILCIDGHASHLTTQAIQYCVSRKIILLCLPAHTTHLLQPLDVGVFAPLATAYKNHVHRVTRLGASYSIDKVDFLELYQQARHDAITPVIIQKAWQKAGLLPFHPELILE